MPCIKAGVKTTVCGMHRYINCIYLHYPVPLLRIMGPRDIGVTCQSKWQKVEVEVDEEWHGQCPPGGVCVSKPNYLAECFVRSHACKPARRSSSIYCYQPWAGPILLAHPELVAIDIHARVLQKWRDAYLPGHSAEVAQQQGCFLPDRAMPTTGRESRRSSRSGTSSSDAPKSERREKAKSSQSYSQAYSASRRASLKPELSSIPSERPQYKSRTHSLPLVPIPARSEAGGDYGERNIGGSGGKVDAQMQEDTEEHVSTPRASEIGIVLDGGQDDDEVAGAVGVARHYQPFQNAEVRVHNFGENRTNAETCDTADYRVRAYTRDQHSSAWGRRCGQIHIHAKGSRPSMSNSVSSGRAKSSD